MRTRRRLARFRVGCEGRIAHLEREYHAGRARLRGAEGAAIWQNWAVLAYNVDTAIGHAAQHGLPVPAHSCPPSRDEVERYVRAMAQIVMKLGDELFRPR